MLDDRDGPGGGPRQEMDAPGSVPGDADALPRGLSEARLRRDEELAARGWMRRFVGAPPRLEESEELYRGLGLEVLLDPINVDELREECGGCTLALTLFRVLYTRRPGAGPARDGDESRRLGSPPEETQGEDL